MTKRRARKDEIGLFVDSPVWEGDFANIRNGEAKVRITHPRSLQQLRFAWALASKVAEACDWLDTKEDAMEAILIEAKHTRKFYNMNLKRVELRPKPTNFGAMDGTEYTQLLRRMKHVIATVFIPNIHMPNMVKEIEGMMSDAS